MKQNTATITRPQTPRTARDQFLADVIEGLHRRDKELPCKYFYDADGSALFDQICELDEYYPTRVELSILREHADAMTKSIGEDVEFIELGSGSSIKTHLLLERFRSPRAYVPVDISADHLEQTARGLRARYPDLTVLPVAADFTAPFSIPETGDPRARRVVYFPGSTIGNFSPAAARRLLRSIARLVGEGGGLLIGFDVEKSDEMLIPAYNDTRGVTAAFNLNLLRRINRELGGNFDLDAFEHRAIYRSDRERVEMHLRSRLTQTVEVAGHAFRFAEDETILTECSYKYPLAHFAQLTHDAGFRLGNQWTDPDGYFAVQYLVVD